MSSSTRPSRTEIAEGFGALFVIAVGLLGIPLLLATIVGWPLPHHLPTTGQLHAAAGSQIPDTFWPKALAVIAWLAWGYFVFSLLTAAIDVIRSRRRGTWRRAAGRTSMAALVSAVIVLASIRGSAAAHRITPMAAVTAVVDASPSPGILLSASHSTAPTYTVVPGDSLWDIAESPVGSSPFPMVRHRQRHRLRSWPILRFPLPRQPSPTPLPPETVCGASLRPTTATGSNGPPFTPPTSEPPNPVA